MQTNEFEYKKKNGCAVKLGIIDYANMIFQITSSFTFCIYQEGY